MKPNKLTIDEGIDPRFRADVARAEEGLERILGRATSRVEIHWEAPAPGADWVTRLTISDSGVSKSCDFFDSEFREELSVRRRLRNLWDDVLAERASVLRERVHQSLRDSGEGD